MSRPPTNDNFKWGSKTYIMGILNRTPDSFSDGGVYMNIDNAIQHVYSMIEDGADIIDIGGESTRPGSIPVGAEIEMERIIPLIREVSKIKDIIISVDTYRAKTALAAVEAGAGFINDIWGLKDDPEMAYIAAQRDVMLCIMHNRETAKYDFFIDDVRDDLSNSIDIAIKAGVKDRNIIIDPGVGFGKTYEQNIEIMRNINMLKDFGYPVLLGVSRKSVVGLTLDLPVDQRVEGTIAANVIGIVNGVDIIRVHDIKENMRAAKFADKLIRNAPRGEKNG